MDPFELIAQAVGIAAMVFNILSFQQKTRSRVIAFQLVGGSLFCINFLMLGAYVGATEALKVETIEEMIGEMFTGKKAKLVPLNREALQRGIQCAREQLA